MAWILPKQLHTSDYVLDMAALRLDFTESSEICGQLLFVRSKHSPVRTWLQKWKRDLWAALLFGRILKPSHSQSFTDAWTSSLAVTLVSHLAPQGSDSELPIPDTSGHSSQTEFALCDLECVSSRTSRDTLPSDSERSLESWKKLVIRRRGEYSQRVKLAHHTNASECSSWPTIRASEYKDTGPIGSKSHSHMLGNRYLCAVVKDVNWLTPATVQIQRADMQKRIDYRASIGRQYVPGSLEEQMQQHGLPAPANHSTNGNRLESWATPRTGATDSTRPNNKGGIPLGDQVQRESAWATPSTMDHINVVRKPEERSHAANNGGCKNLREEVHQWATPRLGGEEKAETRLARGKDIGLHGQVGAMKNSAKLNPRWVETLMGLPIGWTMPSCSSPVTIELTNCDYSETESCQPQPSEHSELYLPSY